MLPMTYGSMSMSQQIVETQRHLPFHICAGGSAGSPALWQRRFQDIKMKGFVATRRFAMLEVPERTIRSMKQILNPALARVFKRLHYPLDGATRVAVSRASSGR